MAQPPIAAPLGVQRPLGNGDNPPVSTPIGADASFDDNTVHEIRVSINAKDWQTLKDNYLDKPCYPADFC